MVATNVSEFLEKNLTAVIKFILLGFLASKNLEILMFFLFLVLYCFTIFMNILIRDERVYYEILHTPMYFFLTQLSITDNILLTDIVPKMLHMLLHHKGTMTYGSCIMQSNFFGFLEASECLLLTVMSYDRYVAICNPLRYTSIVTSAYCVILAVISWLVGFCIMLSTSIAIQMLNFCGPNIIDHFFCDFLPILELSCSDTSIVQVEITLFNIPLLVAPIIIIIFSYSKIIVTILRIPSRTGRQKAFSTCSSHLIVVSIFYWTLYSVYVLPTIIHHQ
ncbi:hypothetical protein GDO81_019804 [Engystomops pustulosus]|uniref:Olfactory receptor n=1 Tax=Engystomops pustulosus TaxID=76066 RepID=A0AAV6ZAQ5_ENGPU|nr:hypothetical protein GDO81_019804 [Engystomops pustulosus]